MTTPTTPTGQFVVKHWQQADHMTPEDIIPRIEVEAAQQERERLRRRLVLLPAIVASMWAGTVFDDDSDPESAK